MLCFALPWLVLSSKFGDREGASQVIEDFGVREGASQVIEPARTVHKQAHDPCGHEGEDIIGKLIPVSSTVTEEKDGQRTEQTFDNPFTGGGMSKEEQKVLHSVYSAATSVFEWGMGSSTMMAAQIGVLRLTAVDSSEVWVAKCRKIVRDIPNFRLVHVDVGRIELYHFGRPLDANARPLWPFYSTSALATELPFDVYLVDGQFRVACAAMALLHGHCGSKVLVNDFEQAEYDLLSALAHKVEKEGKLVVLRRRKSTTDEQLRELWELHKYRPSLSDPEGAVQKLPKQAHDPCGHEGEDIIGKLIPVSSTVTEEKDGQRTEQTFDNPFTGGGMSKEEQKVLHSVYSAATSVFEWGMGSSTMMAAQIGVLRLTAVDSSEVWVAKCRKIVRDIPNFRLVHVDVGPIGAWGTPSDKRMWPLWPFYSTSALASEQPFDVYLVDGRFRVACAAMALLHGHCGSKVLVHDFLRAEYQLLLQYAEKLEEEHALVVLRRKKSTTDEQLRQLWETYKYHSRDKAKWYVYARGEHNREGTQDTGSRT